MPSRLTGDGESEVTRIDVGARPSACLRSTAHPGGSQGRHLMRLAAALALLAAVLGPPACDEVEISGSKCSDDHPCPNGYACVDGTCYPKGPLEGVLCSQDSDCPAGVCLEQSHVCVACIRHEDCISRLCEPQTHICLGCKADYQCQSGTCDRPTGICAESATEAAGNGN